MRSVIWICVFTLFFSMACGKRSQHRYKGKVYWHSDDGSPTILDPVQSATTYTNMLVTAVYDTLYEYKYLKRPYEIKPNLATAMPEISKDGLVYTFKIKQGVFYIDDPAFAGGKGREVVAEDFIYSIKRHFDKRNLSQGSWLWHKRIVGLNEWGDGALDDKGKLKLDAKGKPIGPDYSKEIEGLKTLDKYTIQVTLNKPYPQLPYTFAMGYSAFVPKEAVEKYGKGLSTHPVGSGPFILDSFNTKKAVLVKNEKYREDIFNAEFEGYDEKIHGYTGIKALDGKKMPIVDTVIISFISQPTARWNSFTKGNETQVCNIPLEQVDEVLASKKPPKLKPEYDQKYLLKTELESGFVFGVFNMDDPNIGYNKDPKRNAMNKALRKALRKAFSWEKRIERFYYGMGEPFAGAIPATANGYTELPQDSILQDVEGAKRLLKDAGWTAANLPVFEYPGVSSVRNKQFFEQVRGWLLAIGYPKAKIKYKTFANFGDLNKAMKTRRNMFNSYGWGLDYPDAENTMQLFMALMPLLVLTTLTLIIQNTINFMSKQKRCPIVKKEPSSIAK